MRISSMVWKLSLTAVAGAVGVGTAAAHAGALGLIGWEHTSNVGASAAMYALCSATILFATLIPMDDEKKPDRPTVNGALYGFSAVFVFLAAWYWLEDETNGEPGIYLVGLFVLGCVVILAVAAAVGVGTFGPYLVKRLSRRRPGTPAETTVSRDCQAVEVRKVDHHSP